MEKQRTVMARIPVYSEHGPDAAAFEHVVESLGCRPASVFLDDNLLNVDAAKRLGMQAVRVQGIDETQRLLIELKIIESA